MKFVNQSAPHDTLQALDEQSKKHGLTLLNVSLDLISIDGYWE